MTDNIKNVAEQFAFDGSAVSVEPYGMGHINDTYLLTIDSGKRYILQKMNNMVFADIEVLMSNVTAVTKFLYERIKARGGNPERECLIVVPSVSGEAYIEEGGGFWRAYVFIEDAVTYQTAETPELFKAAGTAFGQFQNELADFDASVLRETIPNFHNTAKRYDTFIAAVKEDAVGNVAAAKAEIDFVKEHSFIATMLTKPLSEGKLPLRVTHNDTKLNNVMLDPKTQKPLAVIDLDTVMPGLSAYDFGDSIRFGATHAAEDEKDLSKVDFDINLFTQYAKGYVGACGANFSREELISLVTGSIVMTYECGMRFLTDFIDGKGYFKTAYPTHNLDRCRTQFCLVKQMLEQREQMEKIVLEIAGK